MFVSKARKLTAHDTAKLVAFMAQMQGVEDTGKDGEAVKLRFENFDVASFAAIIDFIDSLSFEEPVKRQKVQEVYEEPPAPQQPQSQPPFLPQMAQVYQPAILNHI